MNYRITVHKSYEVEEKEFKNDNKVRNMFINIEPFMFLQEFESLSQDEQKERLNVFLNKITRNDIKSDKKLESRERVLVNYEGDYGFESAVYDSKTKIPKHLRGSK